MGVDILVPLDVYWPALYVSGEPSERAETIDTPGASAKIPRVSASVGPWTEDIHRSGTESLVDAPIATTFRALAGSNTKPPSLPGAMRGNVHGNSRVNASKSADRNV